MDCLKAAMLIVGIAMVLAAVGVLTHDLALEIRYRSALTTSVGPIPAIPKPRWRTAAAFRHAGMGAFDDRHRIRGVYREVMTCGNTRHDSDEY